MRKFYSQDLQHQYEHDSHFKYRVDQSQITYSACLKKSVDFDSISQGLVDSMLQKFIGEDGHETYFFYGYLQPSPSRSQRELLLYFVKNFQPEPGIPFTFVYFNLKTPSSDYYFKFKAVFDLIPLRLIEKMTNFYLVKPYFYIKAYDMLGHSNKIFAERYQTLENCQELLKKMNVKIHDFVTFVPEDISEEFPSNIKRRPSLLNYRINVEGQILSQQQLKDKHDFQLSIKALITKQIYKLQNYQVGELGIPTVLQLLVGYFKEKPASLLQEGIFRKSVSIDEENETLEELSRRNFAYLQQITNPHLIASLIKKFFGNLKQPLIPFALFNKLMHDQGVSNKKEFVKQSIRSLPTLNFLSLMFVIGFLKDDVVPIEKQTKMSAHNLSICFSPAFMRSQKASFADIANASKAVAITDIMFTDYDYIFGSELDRNNHFKKSMIDRRKIINRNLQEKLDIQIDDRASEEIRTNSFINEGGFHPTPEVQPAAKIALSKQVYKVQTSHQHVQKHEKTVKSQIKPAKSQEYAVDAHDVHEVSKSHLSFSHQMKYEPFEQENDENECSSQRMKTNKHDLVERYLKKEKKLDTPQNIDFESKFGKKQSPCETTTEQKVPKNVDESRSSISFMFTSPQK